MAKFKPYQYPIDYDSYYLNRIAYVFSFPECISEDELMNADIHPDEGLEVMNQAFKTLILRMTDACYVSANIQKYQEYLSLAQFIGLTFYMPQRIACKAVQLVLWRYLMSDFLNVSTCYCEGEHLVLFRKLVGKYKKTAVQEIYDASDKDSETGLPNLDSVRALERLIKKYPKKKI